ncbi:MAG: hypothetical protein ACREPQ_14460 [Rhodanobacter sp.]
MTDAVTFAAPDFVRRVDALWMHYLTQTPFPGSQAVALDLSVLLRQRLDGRRVLTLQRGAVGVVAVMKSMLLDFAEASHLCAGLSLSCSDRALCSAPLSDSPDRFSPTEHWRHLLAALGDQPAQFVHHLSRICLNRHLVGGPDTWRMALALPTAPNSAAENAACRRVLAGLQNFLVFAGRQPKDPEWSALARAQCMLDQREPSRPHTRSVGAIGISFGRRSMRVDLAGDLLAVWPTYLKLGSSPAAKRT